MTHAKHLIDAAQFKNANDVLKTISDKWEAPIDLQRILDFFNIHLRYDATLHDTGVLSKLTSDVNNGTFITLNPVDLGLADQWMRYAIAHELGHYCLHGGSSGNEFVDTQESFSGTDTYWHPIESTANDFAVSLLIPVSILLEEGQRAISEYESHNEKKMSTSEFTAAMYERFDVPRELMLKTLKENGFFKAISEKSGEQADNNDRPRFKS